MPIPVGGPQFSPNTSHVIQKWMVNAQRNTPDESLGRPGALHELKYVIFYNIILGLQKATKSQDWFPSIQQDWGYLLYHRNAPPSWQSKMICWSPSSNPIGEICSRYPTNVYDSNIFSLPILRQKIAQSCGMVFIDLPDRCCYGDWNTWNTFNASEQKITLNNRTTNNQTKQSEQNRNKSKFYMTKHDEWMWMWNNWQDDKYQLINDEWQTGNK